MAIDASNIWICFFISLPENRGFAGLDPSCFKCDFLACPPDICSGKKLLGTVTRSGAGILPVYSNLQALFFCFLKQFHCTVPLAVHLYSSSLVTEVLVVQQCPTGVVSNAECSILAVVAACLPGAICTSHSLTPLYANDPDVVGSSLQCSKSHL